MVAEMAERDGDAHTAILERGDGRRARDEAEPLLARVGDTGRVLEGAGDAAILDRGPQGMTLHPNICTALEYPNSIAIEASQRRMELAVGAEALEPALDAAVAGQASGSLERMLCHQLAALHVHIMKHLERSMSDRLPAVEQCRYTNAAARMTDCYQNGMLALRRFRTGGTQTVIVKQQVQVTYGGQAVVAANVVPRGLRTRGRSKNSTKTP